MEFASIIAWEIILPVLSKIRLFYYCQERGINMLFVLGGNGTHAGANAIHDEVVNPGLYIPLGAICIVDYCSLIIWGLMFDVKVETVWRVYRE